MSTSALSLMVDSSSDISIIKINSIKNNKAYNPNEQSYKQGIGKGSFTTIGTTNGFLQIGGYKIAKTFHIVDENFPIQVDGILGRDFFENNNSHIDYESLKID